jgi:hypothetical protein
MLRRRPVLALSAAGLVAVLLFASSPAPGSVEEQRARLPPPAADCSDPVEGVWLALTYAGFQSTWYEETLNVRRKAPGSPQLEGIMTAHFWRGSPTDKAPPPCGLLGVEATVIMPDATGKAEGQNIEFGATKYKWDKIACGRPGIYNPDHYSGTIDPALQEFQSVNNDGGEMVNEPTVFRRISCSQNPGKTGIGVRPPEYQPKRHACSR